MKIHNASDLDDADKNSTFQIVEGQVQNVVSIRGTTYLNFGNDWREDFTASVSSKNKKYFKNQDWKLSELTNKWVRVRGRLRDYNGPYMELIFPQQLEFLGQPEK